MVVKRKLQRTSKDQYTLTIPKSIVELLGWKEHEPIEFGLDHDKITLKRVKRSRGEKHA